MPNRFSCLHLLAFALSSLLTGCTLQTTASDGPTPGVALRGAIYGGQQPIVGAHVYLMAAAVSGVGSAGYGGASTSLLNSVLTGNSDSLGGYVITGAGGNFSLDAVIGSNTTYDYTCPNPTTQVYLYVLGGNPGSGINSASSLMSALGSCGNLSSNTFVVVNEVTTVAAAYALSGFATDGTHVSIPQYVTGTTPDTLAQTGLQNGFLNAAQLADPATGFARAVTPNGNGAPDQTQVYTLANIIAACVNTNGSVSGPTNPTGCYTLFNNAKSGGASGTVPSDTATAAINIAHHPWVSSATMSALYGLQVATSGPFIGASSQPNDFTVGIAYTGPPFIAASYIAIDASGNAWISDSGFGSNTGFVTELSSTGVSSAAITAGGINNPYGIAVDTTGNVWVANHGASYLTMLSSTGTGGTQYTGGQTLVKPEYLAIDPSGNLWTSSSSSGNLSKVPSNGGTGATYAPLGSGQNTTEGLAIDPSGNIWLNGLYATAEVSGSTGSNLNGSPFFYADSFELPYGIAFDASSKLWLSFESADTNNDFGLLKITSGNPPVQMEVGVDANDGPSAFGMAIDGAGSVWVPGWDSYHVLEYSNSGTLLAPASSEFQGGQNNNARGMAVDGSGDVWMANYGFGFVSELIGAATPVVTPVVANLVAPYAAAASRP